MLVDIDRVTAILAEVAAAEILPRFRALEADDIAHKPGGEVVTAADEAAEAALCRALTDLLPGSAFVGEEAVAKDAAVLDRLSEDDPVWIVDPVDGTSNFAEGVPVFAVMAALVQRGRILAAWIHDPIGARTATAEAGAGAWMAGRRLTAAAAGSLQDMHGTLHASSFAPPELARQVRARRERLQTIKSLRCAGQEYIRLASGEMHFSLFTKLAPWDHAPGALIHREAGGTGQMLNGATYDPVRPKRGILLAPDAASWRALHGALFAD